MHLWGPVLGPEQPPSPPQKVPPPPPIVQPSAPGELDKHTLHLTRSMPSLVRFRVLPCGCSVKGVSCFCNVAALGKRRGKWVCNPFGAKSARVNGLLCGI